MVCLSDAISMIYVYCVTLVNTPGVVSAMYASESTCECAPVLFADAMKRNFQGVVCHPHWSSHDTKVARTTHSVHCHLRRLINEVNI